MSPSVTITGLTIVRTMRHNDAARASGRKFDCLASKTVYDLYIAKWSRSISGRRLSVILVAPSDPVRNKVDTGFPCVKHLMHLGNNLKPAANEYPKGFMVKDPARVFSND
jgi:hypothetical protein